MPEPDSLVLLNRHTGERLALRRVVCDGETCLEIRGTLPPRQQGPLHVHYFELEEGRVIAGTLGAIVNGRRIQVRAGESAQFPMGSAHRWWNDGHETVVAEGYARPVVDLDRYLHAIFDVMNTGGAHRPSLFYMAHVLWRHRQTQAIVLMPRPVQAIVLPLVVLVGTLLGRYNGTNWPGSPARCHEAPLVEAQLS